MNKIIILMLLLISATINIDARKMSSRGRSSSKSTSSRSRSNTHPSPTSLSYPQPSVAKPSLFGWQESRTAQKPSNKQSHSYPSSHTGLSGSTAPKQPPPYHESIQRSNAPAPVLQTPHRGPTQSQGTNQNGHSYPTSNGLSGNSKTGGLSGTGAGASYPQQQSVGGASGIGYPQHGTGYSGSNVAPPPYSPANINRPYNAGNQANNYGNGYQHPQGPPPPYSSFPQSYGGLGGHGYNPGYGQQMPGYFGNYVSNGKGFGGMSRTGSALTGVGIAGAGVGTILTGLALWNLARSTGHHHHTVIYDNRGQPVAVAPGNSTEPIVDPILGDLVNCTLTISNDNVTEVLAIPCAIATSFTPDADVKDADLNNNTSDNTKCTVTVVTKTGREFMTTIPCSILLSTAASNNVTEPPIQANSTEVDAGTLKPLGNIVINQSEALTINSTVEYNATLNCTPELGEIRDPINPCLSATNNLTVIPLSTTEKLK
ncbi:uncharacterized protein LOC106720193 [Papilio machaon]|uniref:uncharacterized protein LOC106720193 n=1 Tax=Papilio machaon TaxID=76193 RepID=UPI001E664142|nr:uncharacterized protein LOC106720193 [Papilio machaon]